MVRTPVHSFLPTCSLGSRSLRNDSRGRTPWWHMVYHMQLPFALPAHLIRMSQRSSRLAARRDFIEQSDRLGRDELH